MKNESARKFWQTYRTTVERSGIEVGGRRFTVEDYLKISGAPDARWDDEETGDAFEGVQMESMTSD